MATIEYADTSSAVWKSTRAVSVKRPSNVAAGANAIEWAITSSPPSRLPTSSIARSMLSSLETSHSTTTSEPTLSASLRTPSSSRSPWYVNASLAPAPASAWAMAHAIERLLATPATSASLPSRIPSLTSRPPRWKPPETLARQEGCGARRIGWRVAGPEDLARRGRGRPDRARPRVRRPCRAQRQRCYRDVAESDLGPRATDRDQRDAGHRRPWKPRWMGHDADHDVRRTDVGPSQPDSDVDAGDVRRQVRPEGRHRPVRPGRGVHGGRPASDEADLESGVADTGRAGDGVGSSCSELLRLHRQRQIDLRGRPH